MKPSLVGFFALFFATSLICIPLVYSQQGAPAFSDVNQIFQTRCVKCHSGARPPKASIGIVTTA